jgi:hypothetical protein
MFNTLLLLWISGHLLFLLYLIRLDIFLRIFVNILVIIIFSIIYLVKPLSYDLLIYDEYLKAGTVYPKDIGFILLQYIILKVPIENKIEIISGFLGTLIVIIAFYLVKSRNIEKLTSTVAVILGSVYFVLSTGNALRQGFSSIFLILSYLYIFESKIKSVLFLLLATSFHSSAPIFYMFFLVTYLVQNISFNDRLYIETGKFIKKIKSRTFIFKYSVAFLWVFCIFSIVCFVGLFFIRFTDFGHYLDFVLEGGRMKPVYKIIPVAFMFFLSEYFVTQSNSFTSQSTEFKRLRLLRFYLFILLLSLLPYKSLAEAWSRILFFYFCVDAYMLVCLKVRNIYDRLYFSLVNFSNGFYINAINVLTGGFYTSVINALT